MKYIRTEDENGTTEIFTFPITVNHDCMMESLSGIKNHTYHPWERVRRHPVSAGFVDAAGNCYGRSESLGLESSPKDTQILSAQLAMSSIKSPVKQFR
ncbi:MAG: hypothetical protein RKH07_12620 [Gammaproteobacteria bacterium]